MCVCVFLTTHLFDCMFKVCAGLHCLLQRFLLETNWPLASTTPLRFGKLQKHSSEKCKSSSGCYGKNAVWVTAGLACLGLGAKGSMVEIATASSCRFWPAKTCCCNVASSLEVPTSVPAVASHLSQASWQGDAHV